MLHHVSVGVADVERAARFYDAALAALGYKRSAQYLPYAIAYGEGTYEFWIQLPHNREHASVGNGAHVGFSARSKDAVHKFHEAALANGGKDDGAPGPRPDYGPDYYGAFVIDVDGNKVEAVLHPRPKASPKARLEASAKRTKKGARKAKARLAKGRSKARKGGAKRR